MAESQTAEIVRWIAAWGPGVLILVGLYRLLTKPPEFLNLFIAAQQGQAVAMAKLADAVQTHTSEGDRKLDELLINDQVILRRLENLPCAKPCPRCGQEKDAAHGPH